MNSIDPIERTQEEVPADPTTQRKLRRSLLYIALGSLLAPCGICWYSTRVQSVEGVMIPGLLGIVVLIYTLYILYQREQKQDLAPPLWRVGLILGAFIGLIMLAIIWLMSSIGWQNISGSAILILGAWAFFLAGRRVWESWSFFRQAVVEENDFTKLNMISIRGSHPIHPQLAYRYAEKYGGKMTNNKLRNRTPEIQKAISEGKFLVKIQYLPENPRVHRFLGWKVLP